jgi:hypothetical protein
MVISKKFSRFIFVTPALVLAATLLNETKLDAQATDASIDSTSAGGVLEGRCYTGFPFAFRVGFFPNGGFKGTDVFQISVGTYTEWQLGVGLTFWTASANGSEWWLGMDVAGLINPWVGSHVLPSLGFREIPCRPWLPPWP